MLVINVEGLYVNRLSCLFSALLAIHAVSLPAFGKLEDVEQQQAKSRNQFTEQFKEFTQNKNFLGKPQDWDGNAIQGKKKTRFDGDDQLPFQSDLTYHDFSYEVEDESFAEARKAEAEGGKKDDGAKTRTLFAGISGHGAISASGGSSKLERTAYQEHDKYAKQEDSKEKKEADEKKGINYRGVFKVETQEVFKDGKSKKGDDQTPDKVERWSLREESAPVIGSVGSESFSELETAAKEKVAEEEGGMGTLSFYYKAANTAMKALWSSTLANLGQRRTFKGIEPDASAKNPQLSEEFANCDAWAQAETSKLQDKDPKRREEKAADIQRMKGQCAQMAKVDYKKINPRFEKDEKNPKGEAQLTFKGPEKEDARERDWRVALEVYGSVGTRPTDVQSNWKYKDNDDRNKVTTKFDENGQPVETQDLTMYDQVEQYNDLLQKSADAIPDIKARYPQLKLEASQILQKKIEKNTKRMDEITQFPAEAGMEDFEPNPQAQNQEGGGQQQPSEEKLPESYDELVQSGQAK